MEDNYISLLNQRCQLEGRSPQYKYLAKEGKFLCEVSLEGLIAKGEASNKKIAKNLAAKTLIAILKTKKQDPLTKEEKKIAKRKERRIAEKKAERAVQERKNEKKIAKQLAQQALLAQQKKQKIAKQFAKKNPNPIGFVEKSEKNNPDRWRKCMELLPSEDENYVKLLKIFALNTGTGAVQYQVNAVQQLSTAVQNVVIYCTWNQFFVPAEGPTKPEALQEAAHKMLNKAREICGMSPLPERSQSSEVWSPEDMVVGPDSDNDLVTAYRKLIIGAKGKECEPVHMLEELSHLMGCEDPEYKVTSVNTEGLSVMVTVTCSWRAQDVVGVAANKRLAETQAATVMLAEVEKISKVSSTKVFKDNVDSSQESIDITYSNIEQVVGDGATLKGEPGVEPDDTKYCQFPPGDAASISVTRKDFCCLQEEEFLNDVIIDFYLMYLQLGLFVDNPAMQERTHIFSNYFYSRLTQKTTKKQSVDAPPISPAERSYNNVIKWTKNTNIFDKDFVIIPINDSDHWYAVVICFPGLLTTTTEGNKVKRPIMLLFDSLEDGCKDEVIENLRSYLACEWYEKMVKKGLAAPRTFQVDVMPSFCPEIPQQPNLTDCGLYLLEYVEAFFRSPIEDFSVPLVSLSNWFTKKQVDGKRAFIARLIKRLSKEQNPEKNFQFPVLDCETNLELEKPEDVEMKESNPVKDTSDNKVTPKIKFHIKPRTPLTAVSSSGDEAHKDPEQMDHSMKIELSPGDSIKRNQRESVKRGVDNMKKAKVSS